MAFIGDERRSVTSMGDGIASGGNTILAMGG